MKASASSHTSVDAEAMALATVWLSATRMTNNRRPFAPLFRLSSSIATAVIAECTKHKEQNSQNADYQACVDIGTEYFVKHGVRRDLEPERATQEFIFAHSNTPDAPRIARIVHHFVDQRTMYLVMERIKLQESPPDLLARAQKAVKWLLELFKEFKAPFEFPVAEMLDRYMKKAYGLLSVTAWQKVSPVSVCGERLMFTQSDMDDSNFGVDEHERTVLMDFSEIGLLPETFVAYTLSSDNNLGPIAASLGLSGNSNLVSMAAIAHCLGMVSDPKLGTSTCA
ncbi:hypothetical protein SCLCIDRAFT_18312 [Scleroderma citrinum Foug A]|uniref:Aminoglycoside phosphotransferase domain-containing protein n=1 Tax=Scleroderma citrinum Foug A TaxID=1036808 RepID=A0A0C3D5N8_9AGAM|nr:hypothetical protein SCLCIDRAFT_18312 [Scleroderma citrinum Foug A]